MEERKLALGSRYRVYKHIQGPSYDRVREEAEERKLDEGKKKKKVSGSRR